MPSEASLANLQPPWRPGQSAYSAGAAKVPRQALTFARRHCLEAFQTALQVMRDPQTPAPTKLNAALALIDRALGKPKEHVTIEGGINMLHVEFTHGGEHITITMPQPAEAPAKPNGHQSPAIDDVDFSDG